MKKILLSILLISLVLFELVIFTGFLPAEWQHPVYERISNILPDSPHDWSRVTHPRMDLEMDEVFRQHFWLRIACYVILTLVLAANTILIRLVWRRVRTLKNISEARS
jgi:hypothetical protein